MTLSLFMIALVAFAAVVALIPPARLLAFKIGLVDKPGGRKQHEEAVPVIGGLVIFPVFMIGVLATGGDLQTFGILFITLIMILVMGSIDDFAPLPAWLKFAVQLVAATLIVILGGAKVTNLGDMFGLGDLVLGWMSIPFSIAAVALLINSINLMDGLDGLAGGKSFVAIVWLLIACFAANDVGAALPLIPLAGALAGFLFYNMRHPLRKKASVFLGDAGSLCLGLSLAYFCITLAQQPQPVLAPISVAWILAIPIMDECAQFYRRVREGRHPFSPDRGHFHHHFIHAGLSAGRSTFLILALGFLLGGIGYIGIKVGIPQVILTISWIFLLLWHMAFSERAENYERLVSRLSNVDN